MRGYLLDTHAFLWASSDSPELSKTARQVLRMRSTIAYVSPVSLWEIAIKRSRGALRLHAELDQILAREFEINGYVWLPLDPEHILAVNRLPYPMNGHQDPFDRMLVAQAQVERLDLLSGDEALDAYAVKRVW